MLFKVLWLDGETNFCLVQALPEYDAMIENNSCSLANYLGSTSTLPFSLETASCQNLRLGYSRPEHIQYSNYHHKCLRLDNLLVGRGSTQKSCRYFNSTYGRSIEMPWNTWRNWSNSPSWMGTLYEDISWCLFRVVSYFSPSPFFFGSSRYWYFGNVTIWDGLKICFPVHYPDSRNQIR